MQENFLTRSRKFSPKTFFTSVLHLAVGTNKEGSFFALHRSWTKCGLSLTEAPTKSSLSEYREKVSHHFFKDLFEEDLSKRSRKRRTFRGFYIYAVDGDHLDLPASEDIFKSGYRGFPVSKKEETHYPKMYTVQAIDVVSGLLMKFKHSTRQCELEHAREMVPDFEKNSITIYDRLHQTYLTALAHELAGNYFFVRVKSKNLYGSPVIREFCRSKKRSGWIDLEPSKLLKSEGKPVLKLRMIKVKNKSTREDLVFLTNVPEGIIANKDAARFYLRRWGIESVFKDMTDTFKLCQWHSVKLNGILQEIFAFLWFINNARQVVEKISPSPRRWLEHRYKKANFKLIAALLVDHFDLALQSRLRELIRILSFSGRRSIEKRKHLSRSYPRQAKRFGKKYRNKSRVPRRNPMP